MNQFRQIFIIALSKHRNFGNLLVPYLAEQIPGEPFVRLLRKVKLHDLNDPSMPFDNEEVRVVKTTEKYSDESLVRKYCPDKPASELQNMLRKEEVKLKVVSYIEGILTEILDLLKNSNIPVYQKREKYTNLYAEDLITLCFQDTGTVFNFARSESGIRYWLTLRKGKDQFPLLGKNIEILVNDPCRIYYQNRIYFFDDISAAKILPFRDREFISIPKKMEDRYLETFVLNAIRCHEVMGTGFEIRVTEPERKAVLTLARDLNDSPLFELQYTYNGIRLNLKSGESRAAVLTRVDDQIIFESFGRDFDWEWSKLEFLWQIGLEGSEVGLKIRSTDNEPVRDPIHMVISWLSLHAAGIANAGIEVSQAGLAHPYYLGSHDLQINMDHKTDWFDLEITVRIGELHIPFVRFKRYVLNGIREYKLPNGELFILPESWFTQFGDIFSLGRIEAQKIILKPFHYVLLGPEFTTGKPDLQDHLQSFGRQEMVVQEIPGDLRAELRSYQHIGFNWLYHLWQNNLNGCLADDMGLGKTLQTLVLLLKLRRDEGAVLHTFKGKEGQPTLFDHHGEEVRGNQPASLIVLPVSLLHNWENEIRKFAPSLVVYTYTGVKRREKIDLATLVRHCDIILTTYGTVRNDSEVLAKHTFFYLILDESQNIKNSESKSYKAVSSLHSRHRLSLTGTPIENSLSDLWSQMNFLNPGQLGSFRFFKESFLVPIERDHDQEMTTRLSRLIEPFILRRTKEEVEADLPPVTEEILTIEMTSEQLEMYESEKSAVRNYLLRDLDEMNPRNTAFVVLQALTRLRQIAIHPRLIDLNSDFESGKFNEILSMLEVLVAENHKILVFSSFVKHLNLLGEVCKSMNWGHCRLTGQTTDRKSVISEFQSGHDKNIFLISLKAGGVGLNLTAADYIFIIDPWWNPAAELQAISRAHRIGQDKKVFVYRFISAGTIEEKIQMLQEKKASLAKEFINRNDPFSVFGKDELIQLFE